jgi:hypothetical protein
MKKSVLKQIIKEELNNILNENTKVSTVKDGYKFVLPKAIDDFDKGETVTVVSTKPYGGDNILLTITNGKITRTLQFDRNDDLDTLDENIK